MTIDTNFSGSLTPEKNEVNPPKDQKSPTNCSRKNTIDTLLKKNLPSKRPINCIEAEYPLLKKKQCTGNIQSNQELSKLANRTLDIRQENNQLPPHANSAFHAPTVKLNFHQSNQTVFFQNPLTPVQTLDILKKIGIVDSHLIQDHSIKLKIKFIQIKAFYKLRLGMTGEALNLFNESFLLAKTNNIEPDAFGLTRYAEALRVSGQFTQCKNILFKALEKCRINTSNTDQEHTFALSRLGAVMVDSGEYTLETKEIISTALQNSPEDSVTIHYAKKIFPQGYLSNNDISRKANPQNKSKADMIFQVAYRYLCEGKVEVAYAKFSEAIHFYPKHYQSYIYRGGISRHKKEYSKAKDDFLKAVELSPKNPFALFGLGDCLIKDTATAGDGLDLLNLALTIDPAFIIARVTRGEYYRKISEYEEALSDFDIAIEQIENYHNSLSATPNYSLNSSGFLKPDKPAAPLEHQNHLVFAYGRRGMVKYRSNRLDLDSAISDFDKALELDPHDVFSLSALGTIKYETKSYDQAKYFFKEVLKKSSKHTQSLNCLGEIARIHRQFTDAKNYFKKSIKITQNNAFAYERLGDIYREEGEKEKALYALSQALMLDPNRRLALSSRGDLLRSMLRLEEARRDLERALSLGVTNDPFIYSNLGEVYRLCGAEYYDLAIQNFKNAIKVDENYSFAYLCMAKLTAAYGKYDSAIEYLSTSIDLDKKAKKPINAQTLLFRANIYLNQDNYKAAFQDLIYAEQLAPSQPTVYRYWAMYYYRVGRLDQSLQYLTQAIDLSDNKAMFLGERAKINFFLQNYDQAFTDANAALKINNNESTALSVKGVLLSFQNDDLAEDILKKAISINYKNGFAHTALGEHYRTKRQFAEASSEFELAILHSPRSPMPYLLRGVLNFERGRYILALEDFKKYQSNSTSYKAPISKNKEAIDTLVECMKLLIFLQAGDNCYTDDFIETNHKMLKKLNRKTPSVDLKIFDNLNFFELDQIRGEHKQTIIKYIEALANQPDIQQNPYIYSSLSVLHLLLNQKSQMTCSMKKAISALKSEPCFDKKEAIQGIVV